MKSPKTLQEAIVYFSDPQRAFEYAVKLRWPDGKVVCPRCTSDSNYFIKTRRLWLCRGCDKQFTVKVGTIFEDSPLGMDKWMTAFWMIVNARNGVSSCEIARSLGITQKSAWFMLHRIRTAMQAGTFVKLGGAEAKSKWTKPSSAATPAISTSPRRSARDTDIAASAKIKSPRYETTGAGETQDPF